MSFLEERKKKREGRNGQEWMGSSRMPKQMMMMMMMMSMGFAGSG